ncbi:GntR family transcriptional regulator [Bordetella ansorpii]|uniref:GntR family transcriptional regulator n=1 Tax=Bordetella ansorpii TaxID=288768 RepID=A0A157SL65_9BORD|nr:GntR family transcriptional regulator [Bordetella ansorpii]SAI70913.1 GntR family transcriptional regulator [Bordetella ansorpii]
MKKTQSATTNSLSGNTGLPLYQRVVAVLREAILRGEFPIGSQLPTENELCERFDISRHTVRAALRELRAQNLVTSRRGSGTTVIHPDDNPQTYVHRTGTIADLVQYALGRWDIVDSEMVELDEAQARRLDSAVGARWLRMRACRYQDEPANPVSWTEFYLHADYAQVARLIGKDTRPIHELVQELYGAQVDEVTQTMRAVEVPEYVARRLKLKKRSTVISVERIYRLANGKVIEASTNLYPAANFQFEIKLRRTGQPMPAEAFPGN